MTLISHVACLGEIYKRIRNSDIKGRARLQDIIVDGRKILKRFLDNRVLRCGLDSFDLG